MIFCVSFVRESTTTSVDFPDMDPNNELLHVANAEVYLKGRTEAPFKPDPVAENTARFKGDCK